MSINTTSRAMAAALLLLSLPAAALAQGESDTSTLFVVTGPDGSVQDGALTIDSPSIVWFTDRPAREAGHIDAATLASVWAVGDDSFAEDPPNAVLSVPGEDAPSTVVIELVGVSADADSVTFAFETLDGDPPTGAIASPALFIDNWFTSAVHKFKKGVESVWSDVKQGVSDVVSVGNDVYHVVTSDGQCVLVTGAQQAAEIEASGTIDPTRYQSC